MSDKVITIKEEIEQATFAKCWMDLDGISYDSPDFADVIVKAIDDAPVFVFMLSEHLDNGNHVKGCAVLRKTWSQADSLI